MKKISDKKLAKLGGKVPFRTISSKPKRIRKVNPKAQAKRKVGYRKMLAGKEYKAARAEAMERAGGRCELWWELRPNGARVPKPGPSEIYPSWRCAGGVELHAHHKSYPKTRPLAAPDLTICCKPHHEYLESLKPHKTRMF